MAMWYNRVSWAFLLVLLLLYVPKSNTSRFQDFCDVIVASLILIFLVYLKISYGIVAIIMIILISILKKNYRLSIFSLAIGACVALLIESIWHLNGPYFKDIIVAFSARGPIPNGWLSILRDAVRNAHEIGLLVIAVFLSVNPSRRWIRNLPDVVFSTAVLLTGLVVLGQNAQNAHIPTLLAPMILAAEVQLRQRDQGARDGWRLTTATALLVVATFLAKPIVYQMAGLVRHSLRTATATISTNVPRTLQTFLVEDPELRDLLPLEVEGRDGAFPDYRSLHKYVVSKQILFQGEYFETVVAGVRQLQALEPKSADTVVVFDMTNPFSFAAGLRPARGTAAALVVDYLFTPGDFIPASEFFADVDFVMVPKKGPNRKTRDAMMDIYDEYLSVNYRVVSSSDLWTVFFRDADQQPPTDGLRQPKANQ